MVFSGQNSFNGGTGQSWLGAPHTDAQSVPVAPRPVPVAPTQTPNANAPSVGSRAPLLPSLSMPPAAQAVAMPSAPSATTNTSAQDPNIAWLIDKYKGRFSADNSQRAMDKSNAGIADATALLGKDARAGLASRGALDSGVAGEFTAKHITDPALRAAAGAASGIALGEQQRQDNLTLGGLGIMKSPAEIAIQQQQNANQQYSTASNVAIAQQQDARAAQAQAWQRQQAQLQALMAMMNGI